jgi:hypothetical protein
LANIQYAPDSGQPGAAYLQNTKTPEMLILGTIEKRSGSSDHSLSHVKFVPILQFFFFLGNAQIPGLEEIIELTDKRTIASRL